MSVIIQDFENNENPTLVLIDAAVQVPVLPLQVHDVAVQVPIVPLRVHDAAAQVPDTNVQEVLGTDTVQVEAANSTEDTKG